MGIEMLLTRFLPMIAISEVKGVIPQADPHHRAGGARAAAAAASARHDEARRALERDLTQELARRRGVVPRQCRRAIARQPFEPVHIERVAVGGEQVPRVTRDDLVAAELSPVFVAADL